MITANYKKSQFISIKAVVEKALQQLDTLTEAISNRLVPYESLTVNVPDLDIFMRSVNAKELRGLYMVGGGAEFKLPDSFDMPGLNGVVNAKVFSMFPCFLDISLLPCVFPYLLKCLYR